MRYVVPIFAVIVLVAGLVGVKATQIKTLMKAGQAAQVQGPPPEVVSSSVAKSESWENTIPAVGSVEAVKGVTVSNDAAGVVTAIKFESGATVKQGDVLVQLDANVETAQLASANSRKILAAQTLKRDQALVASGTLAGVQLENDEAALHGAEADVAALQAQIARKIVRAPFSGKLGIRAVNLGQYLSSGTAITSLQVTDVEYVDFTLPQQRLGDIAVGTPVRLALGTEGGGPETTIDGTVSAIDPAVDPVTRAIKVRATPQKSGKLRAGMFINVSVVLPTKQPVIAVPATAIIHATYGNSVFVIEEKPGPDGKPAKFVRQQFVRTGESRGDFVSVLEGLKGGEELVVAGGFKLRNGARVVINNDVKLEPSLTPKVENH
ncbi:MAG: efflux RND transporter periplasmic adaptor subunit [Polyangiales bacterium]